MFLFDSILNAVYLTGEQTAGGQERHGTSSIVKFNNAFIVEPDGYEAQFSRQIARTAR